jgi:hypothetical protein
MSIVPVALLIRELEKLKILLFMCEIRPSMRVQDSMHRFTVNILFDILIFTFYFVFRYSDIFYLINSLWCM